MAIGGTAVGLAGFWELRAVLPSPRFSRTIGLVLDGFRGEKIAVASCGFLGFFLCKCRYFWASFKWWFYVMCYIFYVS